MKPVLEAYYLEDQASHVLRFANAEIPAARARLPEGP
jgi:hypothetical protein